MKKVAAKARQATRKDWLEVDVLERVSEHMANDYDTDGQSDRLIDEYEGANEYQREMIDRIFINLCGWSLKSILTGGDQ